MADGTSSLTVAEDEEEKIEKDGDEFDDEWIPGYVAHTATPAQLPLNL